MHRRALPVPVLSLLAVALAGALLLVAGPAQAMTSTYVALGDSYASGDGTRVYDDDGTDCYRSPEAYGPLVAAAHGLRLTLAACTGAVTADVVRLQSRSLRASTDYVSVTVGGNDLGFTSVLTECAKPGWASDCDGAVDGAERVLRRDLPGRLTTLLRTVRSRAPRARVVVVGYPHVFNGQDCNAATFFSPHEERRLNQTTDELDRLLQDQAEAAGDAFVSPVDAFTGHAICSSAEWVNGLSHPVVDSYHPNQAGQRAYASLVTPALLGPEADRPAAVSGAGRRPGTGRSARG